jgi:hypothetical protein
MTKLGGAAWYVLFIRVLANQYFFVSSIYRLLSSPKMAEVSRRHFPRSNTTRSIHTPLSLGLRADAELHSVVLFKRCNTHAVALHILAYQHIPA